MINILAVYDDNDAELAEYFDNSHQYICDCFPDNPNINLQSLNGLSCHQVEIAGRIATFANQPFIFIGISHGKEGCLHTSNHQIVDMANITQFTNSFFYTAACKTAITLGQQLIDNGCLAYIGFKNNVGVIDMEEYHEIFIECENHGIIEFLNSNKTIEIVYNEMIEVFTKHYEKLLLGNGLDKLVAIDLLDNRLALERKGNANLTREHFIIN
ncbi:MAG: hypothetical protein U0T07_07005 [Chitinophagales bacterium]